MKNYFRILKNVNIFKSLPDADIKKIEKVCVEKTFEPGDVIIEEGAIGRHFYIIIAGAVEISKNYNSKNQDTLAIFKDGMSFGELALIDDFPRSATVVAQKRTTLLIIERKDFHRVVKGSINIAFSMMKYLSAMIRERTDAFVESLQERNRNLKKAYDSLKKEIEDRRLVEKQLHHQAFYDGLTGLPNRPMFLDRLQEIMRKSHITKCYDYAVLYMDIDRFSVINESMGHEAGDEILLQIALRLKDCLRRTEILARFSGDEFALLVEKIRKPEDIIRVARRIINELKPPFTIYGKEIFVTACIGIVRGDPNYRSTVDILRDADIAMYGAKSQGLSRYQIYNNRIHEKTIALLQLETDIRGAVERSEFALMYQPIVSLKTCEVMGFETLVRWKHPERGIISPEVFIPIAEKTGVILPLGRWILKTACFRMASWQKLISNGSQLFLNINISGKQFMEPGLVAYIKRVLKEAGLSASLIKVELTESVLLENIDRLIKVLEEMKSMGIKIAIDDFGTGYSSLSYLYKFPIDILKIDRSFIMRMDRHDKKDLVPVIISIARNMKMEVVAEGIETVDQLEILRNYGCEYAQGFLFSKPLETDEVTRLLSGSAAEICLWTDR